MILFLCLFELIPVDFHVLIVSYVYAAPDVWVTVNDLGVDGGDDVGHAEAAVIDRDLAVQDDLQQQITQLFAERRQIAGAIGVFVCGPRGSLLARADGR